MSFEKFTDKARKVLVLAQDEARALHQPYVGTEHILLGLIQEKDGLAAQALDRLNVTYDGVVQAIRQVVTIDEDADVSGHLSFTPRVKRVLENSLREAMQMGQSYISTEHLLLGIVREGEGTALEVLGRLNVSGDDVRGALNDLVGQSPVYAGRSGFDGPASSDSMLTEFGTDLTKKARDGKLDPVIGRASEIERVMQILSRRQKNNPAASPRLPQIQKEAFRWKRLGVDTLERAEDYLRREEQVDGREWEILSSLGVAERRPAVGREREYIAAWVDMGVSDELIRMAYERTVYQKKAMNWPYMNKILLSWHQAGYKTPQQVEEGDKPPRRQAAPAKAQPRDFQPSQERVRKNNEWLKQFLEEQKKGEG